jgi:Flp pilus assembly protein TadD
VIDHVICGESRSRSEIPRPTLPWALAVRPYTCFVPDQPAENTYSLYRRGVELLEDGSFSEATVPLAEAARQAPEKSSVREALGRAYFRNRQFEKAATEFEAVVETHPVNDYAHFCLGRALSLTGHIDRARHHLALASNLRPERRDYRIYRERLAAQAS